MKVYIVILDYQYEAGHVKEVFKSLEGAKSYIENYVNTNKYWKLNNNKDTAYEEFGAELIIEEFDLLD